jgi:uncharacterized membrane protein
MSSPVAGAAAGQESNVQLGRKLKKYFLTGLVVLGPLGLTLLVVQWVVGMMDRLILTVLPDALHPSILFPGFGVLGTVVLVLVVGMLTANVLGRALVTFSEHLMGKIPLIKGIYGLFKQVTETIFSKDKGGFRKVVLIEYPRRGIWSVGFLTGAAEGELQRVTEHRLVNVFVPTTPVPTSGFYVLVPEEDILELQMTVDEAFKLIVSGGMAAPPDRGTTSP